VHECNVYGHMKTHIDFVYTSVEFNVYELNVSVPMEIFVDCMTLVYPVM
jgi:hypothetical protein